MLFLGQAANYRAGDIAYHLFATGTKNDSKNLREHLAARYETTFDRVTLYHTGRAALSVALKTLLPKNSKVLINGFTCHAVVEAVKSAGCVPVFADIEQKTLHFGPAELRAALKSTPDLKAFIVQNSLGIPVDIAPLEKLAKQNNLIIIEDLAHCAGVLYPDGRTVGTVGAAAAFSFGKMKSIDTISGGALVFRLPAPKTDQKSIPSLPKQPTARPNLSDSLRDRWYPLFGAMIRGAAHLHLEKPLTAVFLKLHFIQRSADAELDSNHRLTHWQAKLALRQFKNLKKSGREPLRTPVFVENRDELLKELKQAGFHFDELWYDPPVSPERYYKKAHFPEKDCPNAVKVAAGIINLPSYYSKSALAPALSIIKRYKKHD